MNHDTSKTYYNRYCMSAVLRHSESCERDGGRAEVTFTQILTNIFFYAAFSQPGRKPWLPREYGSCLHSIRVKQMSSLNIRAIHWKRCRRDIFCSIFGLLKIFSHFWRVFRAYPRKLMSCWLPYWFSQLWSVGVTANASTIAGVPGFAGAHAVILAVACCWRHCYCMRQCYC